MPSGYIQPHTSGPGGGSSKIRVNNTNLTAPYQIQWRYKSGVNPYSPWWEQGTTQSGLVPGTYTVNFKMKNAGTGNTAPPDEPVNLASNELETLPVAWRP
jgi:hypothetical protein